MEELRRRRDNLRRAMREREIDATIVAPGPNLHYLTDYWGHISRRFTALAIGAGDGQEIFVCPGFEESLHRQNLKGVENVRTWPRAGNEWAGALDAVKSWKGAGARVAVDPALPWGQTEPMLREAPGCEFISAQGVMADVRMVKSASELALMKKATVDAARIIERVVAGLAEGEPEDRFEKEFLVEADAGDARAQSWIMMLFGPSAAEPHGVVDRRRLARGDVALFDYGTQRERYHSDATRTVFFGEVEDEAKRVWEIVHRAHQASRAATRPGATFTEIDAAARKVITDAGYGERFNHGVGHGIGLEIHELPYPEPGRDVAMKPGMTITIEPGIYLPGRFGVRLEDAVVVTENGCEPIHPDPPMRPTLGA